MLDKQMPNTSNGVGTPNSELEAYPLAKVQIFFYLCKKPW